MKDIDAIDACLTDFESTLFVSFPSTGDVQDLNVETALRLMNSLMQNTGDSSGSPDDWLMKTVRSITEYRDIIEAALKDDATNQRLLRLFARARRVASTLYAGRNACLMLQRIRDEAMVRDNVDSPEFKAVCGMSSSVDGADVNKYQQFVLYLLETAAKAGYAKQGNQVYERVRDSRTGQPTTAWKAKKPISEFVYDVTSRAINFDQWVNMTASPGNAANAAMYLEHCSDPLFPSLKTDRHMIAFTDGVYITKEDMFYPHDQVPDEYANNKATSQYFDTPFPIDKRGKEFAALTSSDISTPHMQSILDYQEFSDEVSGWMYAFLGRMLYAVGEKDNWQVMPFLLGMAQSGKSTVLMNVVAKFFEIHHVGVLSNNVEKKFGLSGFADKYMFIAPEVNESLCIDQAEFQSVVAGDMMQIAKKHETSSMVSWGVPGILAGNQVPAWKDTAGSIVRRIVVFRFGKSVTEANTELPKRLGEEVSLCLIKCNKAYLETVGKCGNASIWKCLPEYFQETQRQLRSRVNSLFDYMKSDHIVAKPGYYMPWSEFVEGFRAYCSANQVPFINKNQEDTYVQCLQTLGCRKTKAELREWPLLGGIKKRRDRCNADAAIASFNKTLSTCPAPSNVGVSTMNIMVNLNVSKVSLAAMKAKFDEVGVQKAAHAIFVPDVPYDADVHAVKPMVCLQKDREFNNSVIVKYKRDRDSTIAIKLFVNGTLQISGCRKIDDALKNGQRMCRFLEMLDNVPPKKYKYTVVDFDVHMINCNFRLGSDMGVNLARMCDVVAEKYRLFQRYDPNSHPGLIITIMSTKNATDSITAMVFANANVILTGFKYWSEMVDSYKTIMRIFDECSEDILQRVDPHAD